MKIILHLGETLDVDFEDYDCPLNVSFDGGVTVTVQFPDQQGRGGIVYNDQIPPDGDTVPSPPSVP